MIEILTARCGLPTARAGRRYLHSSVDPAREARRRLDSLPEAGAPGATIVLVGPGLNYLSSAILRISPSVRIVTFHVDRTLASASRYRVDWCWADGAPTGAALWSLLGPADTAKLVVIETDTVAHVYPERVRLVLRAIRDHIDAIGANIRGDRSFAASRLRNAVRNVLRKDARFFRSIEASGTRVVAASGPSMNAHLKQILLLRSRMILVALPSSCCALSRAGAVPDVVVATDAGYWAGVLASTIPPGALVVASPEARLGRLVRPTQIMLVEGSASVASLLARSIGIPVFPARSHPSVAGTAIELIADSTETAWVLGLDLATDDVIEHVRPHPFDSYFARKVGRTRPFLSVLWDRVVPTTERSSTESRSRRGYGHRAFARDLEDLAGRRQPPAWRSAGTAWPLSRLLSGKGATPFVATRPAAPPSIDERRDRLRSILIDARQSLPQRAEPEILGLSSDLESLTVPRRVAVGLLHEVDGSRIASARRSWRSGDLLQANTDVADVRDQADRLLTEAIRIVESFRG